MVVCALFHRTRPAFARKLHICPAEAPAPGPCGAASAEAAQLCRPARACLSASLCPLLRGAFSSLCDRAHPHHAAKKAVRCVFLTRGGTFRDDGARPPSLFLPCFANQPCSFACPTPNDNSEHVTMRNWNSPTFVSLAVAPAFSSPFTFRRFCVFFFPPRPPCAKLKTKSDYLPTPTNSTTAPGSPRDFVPSGGPMRVQQHGRQA